MLTFILRRSLAALPLAALTLACGGSDPGPVDAQGNAMLESELVEGDPLDPRACAGTPVDIARVRTHFPLGNFGWRRIGAFSHAYRAQWCTRTANGEECEPWTRLHDFPNGAITGPDEQGPVSLQASNIINIDDDPGSQSFPLVFSGRAMALSCQGEDRRTFSNRPHVRAQRCFFNFTPAKPGPQTSPLAFGVNDRFVSTMGMSPTQVALVDIRDTCARVVVRRATNLAVGERGLRSEVAMLARYESVLAPPPLPPQAGGANAILGQVDPPGPDRKIRGWACGKGTPGAATVSVTVGGLPGADEQVATVFANEPGERAIGTLCGTGAAHRFSVAVPDRYRGKYVWVYANTNTPLRSGVLPGSGSVLVP